MAQFIYGKNAVLEAIKAKRVLKIFLAPTFSDKEIEGWIKGLRLPVERVGKDVLDAYAEGGLHQGIVAESGAYRYTELKTLIDSLKAVDQPLLLLLDGIQDPHNFGAIIRNAEAFGVHGIIIKKDRQVEVTATVAKVAAGSLEKVAIVQVSNLSQTIHLLKEAQYWIVGSSLSTETDYRGFNYRGPIALAIGSEGEGLSRLVQDNCDLLVKIPMVGSINSLNASAATAVLLAQVYASRFPYKK